MTATPHTARSPGIRSLIPARIDRLPWSRFHTRLVVALGVAWVLDGLEITIASNVGPNLTYVGSLATLLWRRVLHVEDHSVELGAVRDEIITHFFEIRMVNDFNPTLLQFVAVGRDIREIIRNKCHVMAELMKDVKNMEHPD